MTVQIESTERFLRPSDSDRVRRNYRSIQMQQLMAMLRNALLLLAALMVIVGLYRRTQSDRRFAVRHLEIVGTQHAARSDLDRVMQAYVGINLFNLDIARMRRDFASLPWVSRVEIEKKLPDTLRVQIVERTPVALAGNHGNVAYVDEHGTAFAALSPEVGDPDLPLISGASGDDLARCVDILRSLRTHDPDIYARISEVRPLPPRGYAFFDRQLQAWVYANEDDLSSKWRELYAVAAAERLVRGDMAYADLRFNGRVVVKPLRAMPAVALVPRTVVPAQITN
jgi:POTRA domain, FtsQ-type/Cell division protein FtsQ